MLFETVIGLEVHVQLKTQSKLFSGAAASFGASPNSHTSYTDAGLPGTLPVLNEHAVRMAIQFGLAINATINPVSIFERKHYFYPDLPKGYQISQYQHPIIAHGHLAITTTQGEKKQVTITRAHLEEDAGKSIHETHNHYSGIDLNRAGTALLEIVTSPCLHSAEDALSYLKTLHQLVKFLGICDGNMQEGSFRCDVNLSLRPQGCNVLGTRTELKNLNSFRFIEQAIAYEQQRQMKLLEAGKTILQETRLFCPDKEQTLVMRRKENALDYRYFPDLDLPPLHVSDALINQIRRQMPPLPQHIQEELHATAQLTESDIQFLLSDKAIYDYFRLIQQNANTCAKTVVNWLKGPYSEALNHLEGSFENPPVSAHDLATLLTAINTSNLSHTMAKAIFQELWTTKTPIEHILAQEIFQPLQDDTQIIQLIQSLFERFPEQVKAYQAGKEKLLGFFVGHIMKETQGKANPDHVNALLKTHLMSTDPKNTTKKAR